MIDFDK